MDRSALAALLDNDIDDISKAAIDLERDDRRRTLRLTVETLNTYLAPIRTLKTLRFVQAALSAEGNGKLPVAQARLISTAVMAAASRTDAQDVHRAAVDVMSLLAVKSDAERSNLRVLARLLTQSPRDPLGFEKQERSKSARTGTAEDRPDITSRPKIKQPVKVKSVHGTKGVHGKKSPAGAKGLHGLKKKLASKKARLTSSRSR